MRRDGCVNLRQSNDIICLERQKVTRKLNQTKRQLEACTEKKERKKLEKALKGLRVELNYILVRSAVLHIMRDPKSQSAQNYPKLQKYISLFPPEVRSRRADDDGSVEKEEETATEASATDAQRQEIMSDIRVRMELGELSAEPELEEHRPRPSRRRQNDGVPTSSSGPKRVSDMKEDAFFEDEGEDVHMDES